MFVYLFICLFVYVVIQAGPRLDHKLYSHSRMTWPGPSSPLHNTAFLTTHTHTHTRDTRPHTPTAPPHPHPPPPPQPHTPPHTHKNTHTPKQTRQKESTSV